MSPRLSTLVALLAVMGLLGWLAHRARDVTASVSPQRGSRPGSATTLVLQERSTGSEVPCAVPLAWRVARVDPEFGLDAEAATDVLAEAAALWEDATGRDLFELDPEDGFPVRLVYDERQQRAAERVGREGALDALRAEIEARRDSIAERDAELRAATADLMRRLEELDRRVSAHNAAVREWNASDDRSEERGRALEAAGAELQRERSELLAERPALDAEQQALRAAGDRLDDRIAEHERMAEALDTSLPPEEVEAGEYREAVSRRGTTPIDVSREIRLYRFTSVDELRLLAAHEMGHALGLGHLEDPGSVMSARARADRTVTDLSSEDVALFERVCPDGESGADPSR